MELTLNKQEQQVLKNVLHALYHSFRHPSGSGVGNCRVYDVSLSALATIIEIHDRIVDAELEDFNV